MDAIRWILIIFQLLSSIFLIAVVLLQSGKRAGLSGSIAGGADSVFGSKKAKGLDDKLNKWTKYAAVIFILFSLALALLQ